MKILHTSDLHLNPADPKRFETLEMIMKIAKKEKIDLVTISGDLFDNNINADDLKNKVQSLFQNNPFKIILISGNHDATSYKNSYFGQDAIVIEKLEEPYNEFEEVRIWGFPYEDINESEIIERLESIKSELNPDKINILLYHGHLLDLFNYNSNDFGDEEKRQYMPIKLSYFEELNFKYILAGHFHKTLHIKKIKDTFFIYPGSPISITMGETGIRHVIIIDTKARVKSPNEYDLEDSRFYGSETLSINPFDDKSFENIEEEINEIKRKYEKFPQAEIKLDVAGYLNSTQMGVSEKDFPNKIKNILEGSNVVLDSVAINDYAQILESPLYKRFQEKLNSQTGLQKEDKSEIIKLFISAARGVNL